ncbi:Methyltransferase [uncultured virus]|nr:Methyltransferase [uncultured virus]
MSANTSFHTYVANTNTILHDAYQQDRSSLMELLGKFGKRINIKAVSELLRNGADDQAIVKAIKANNSESAVGSSTSSSTSIMNNTARSSAIAASIKRIFTSHHIATNTITNLLDIGSNNGAVTIQLGKEFNTTPANTHGIDIESYTYQQIDPLPGFDFQFYDGYNIPFQNNSIDLVTCLMVLHHVEYYGKTLSEIARVLVTGGYLVIKEHDAQSISIKRLVFIQHLLYDVLDYDADIDKFKSQHYYFETIFSQGTLVNFVTSFGFQLHGTVYNKHHNPTNSLMMVFSKIAL